MDNQDIQQGKHKCHFLEQPGENIHSKSDGLTQRLNLFRGFQTSNLSRAKPINYSTSDTATTMDARFLHSERAQEGSTLTGGGQMMNLSHCVGPDFKSPDCASSDGTARLKCRVIIFSFDSGCVNEICRTTLPRPDRHARSNLICNRRPTDALGQLLN